MKEDLTNKIFQQGKGTTVQVSSKSQNKKANKLNNNWLSSNGVNSEHPHSYNWIYKAALKDLLKCDITPQVTKNKTTCLPGNNNNGI